MPAIYGKGTRGTASRKGQYKYPLVGGGTLWVKGGQRNTKAVKQARNAWIQSGIDNEYLEQFGYATEQVAEGWAKVDDGTMNYTNEATGKTVVGLPMPSHLKEKQHRGLSLENDRYNAARRTRDVELQASADMSIDQMIRQAARYAAQMKGKQARIVMRDDNGKAVSTPFMDMNEDELYDRMSDVAEAAVQSGAGNRSMGSTFSIQTNGVAPSGGYGQHMPAWLKNKKAIFQIINEDELCGQRCLVAALASGDARKKLKQRKDNFTKKAQKMAKELGVNGRMSFDDFQTFADIYRRRVVIMGGRSKVLHTVGDEYGTDDDVMIYFDISESKELAVGHYHLITNPYTFTGEKARAKWCPHCMVSFTADTFAGHDCKALKCRACNTFF